MEERGRLCPSRSKPAIRTKGAILFGAPWPGNRRRIRGSGYFLEDHLCFVDSPGEYGYDEQTRQLYIRLPGDRNPNNEIRYSDVGAVRMSDLDSAEVLPNYIYESVGRPISPEALRRL